MYALHVYSLFLVQKSLPWWLWLFLFLIVVALVVWALTRSSVSEKSTVHKPPIEEHAEGAHHEDGYQFSSSEPAGEMQAEPLSTPIETEPEIIQPADVPIDFADEAPDNRSTVIDFKPDDLTVIEGIGPKIKLILAEAGITRFDQLGVSEPDQLSEIMKNAGLRIANPKTWPSQARMAAAGEWDKLQAYQERLNAGRE